VRVSGIAAAAVAAAAACSTFDSSTDPTASTDAGSDVAVEDAGNADVTTATDGDASGDAGDAGIVNLLVNPDFETLGCAGWEAAGQSLTVSSIARTGAQSCRVCSGDSGASVGIYGRGAGPVPAGARFVGSAYVRLAPDAAAFGTKGYVPIYDDSGVNVEQGPPSMGPVLDDTWQLITAYIDVSTEAGATPYLGVTAVSGPTCFLVDDAVLYRAK